MGLQFRQLFLITLRHGVAGFLFAFAFTYVKTDILK